MSNIELDLSLVEKVIYINLKTRPDRDANIQELLQKFNIAKDKVIRFEAIEEKPGYIGCAKSHEAVLKMAKEHEWDNILILEDDIVFNDDVESIALVNRFLSMLKITTWDVAMLTANYYHVMPFINDNNFLRLKSAHCSCVYLVNKNYYQTLIDDVSEAVRKLDAGGEQVNCALDSHWLPLMAKDRWFGIYPNLGYQKAGYSDVQGYNTNYESVFLKPLADIYVGVYDPSLNI
ncbi:glycosyltransferase family 25 protein [Yersinia intermedia]|uniref:glycosyltransferase family 25 protein n=1 Tax=Yersinia intermedia TaxID=631 RepID=UPI0005ACA1E4|nr:glycosyltransferase family 25 protein [Yersinia intermedia]AJJ19481.1 glycosyltransferase 25 family protein [Yersinia intermedia]